MAEPVTAPDMRIRVGTGSHRCRHSDVRCARGRRANRPFVPLPANARRGAAVHRAGRVARAAGSACRSARSGTTSSRLRLYKSKIQLKISCAFSPNEPNFALMIPNTWVQPTRSSPSSRASVLTPRLMLPSPLEERAEHGRRDCRQNGASCPHCSARGISTPSPRSVSINRQPSATWRPTCCAATAACTSRPPPPQRRSTSRSSRCARPTTRSAVASEAMKKFGFFRASPICE